MKRIMLLLVALTPLFLFSSCSKDDLEDVLNNAVGSIDLKINDQNHSFSSALFYTEGGYTYIATAGDLSFKNQAVKGISANTVVIKIEGTVKAGTYVLGLGKDGVSALANIGQAANILSKNCLAFYPTASDDEAFISIYGVVNVTTATDSKLIGTLSGAGITKNSLSNISDLLSSGGFKTFSGSFTAKNYLKK